MSSKGKVRSASYHEIVKHVLAHGVAAVSEMKPAPSRRTLGRARAELVRFGKKELADELEETLIGDRSRGISSPLPGEKRIYKVQSQNNQEYIRLPTKTIGAEKGGYVEVLFEEGSATAKPVQQ
jgi:hypothetical protein